MTKHTAPKHFTDGPNDVFEIRGSGSEGIVADIPEGLLLPAVQKARAEGAPQPFLDLYVLMTHISAEADGFDL